MQSLHSFIPKKSIPKIQSWIDELNIVIKLRNSRKSKLGDFRVTNQGLFISINNNLNKYSFLITLTHELAHAFVYKSYHNRVKPHGKEWQWTFKSMLLGFMSTDYFPKDILEVLSVYIQKPKASTLTDISLSSILRTYDDKQSVCVSEIQHGKKFKNNSGKIFIKGPKLRKRFKCIECQSKKVYLFHPLAEISLVQ